MTAGPVITMAVITDTARAKRGLEEVQEELEDTGDTAQRAGRKVGDGIGDMTDKVDESERKFRGIGDTITGTGDIMQGFKDGDVVGLAMGLADLAGGIADFVGPALQSMAAKLGLVTVATEGETAATEASNAAMAANPIGLVVAALVALAAVLYLAWTRSETFREVVTGAFDAVRAVAEDVFGWISDHWPLLLVILTGPFGLALLAVTRWRDDIVGLIREVPEKLGELAGDAERAGERIGGAVLDGLKGGISGIGHAVADAGGWVADLAGELTNAVRQFVNVQVIDRVNRALEVSVNTHIPGVGTIGIDPPDIPHLAAGGVVLGPRVVTAWMGDNPSRAEGIFPLEPGIFRRLGLTGGGSGDTIINLPVGTRPDDAYWAAERYRRRNAL